MDVSSIVCVYLYWTVMNIEYGSAICDPSLQAGLCCSSSMVGVYDAPETGMDGEEYVHATTGYIELVGIQCSRGGDTNEHYVQDMPHTSRTRPQNQRAIETPTSAGQSMNKSLNFAVSIPPPGRLLDPFL